MMLLNTLLAGSANAFIQNVPIMVICLGSALLVLAFCIGAKKGLRHVSLFGIFWMATAGTFILAKKMNKGGAATTFKGLIFDAILAVGCVFGSMLVHQLIVWMRRPKVRYVKKKGDRYFKDENGVEYDSEKEDYDDYEKYASTKMKVKRGTTDPKFSGRFFGGLACALNVGLILYLVVAMAMLALIGTMQSKGWVVTIYPWMYSYAIDFAIIGILLKCAHNGYDKGFIESLRVLFVKVGILVAGVASFYLPFSKYATDGGVKFLCSTTNRFMQIVEDFGVPTFAAPFTGRLVCGVVIFAVMLVAIWILNKLFMKLADAVHVVSAFRATDGMLACVVYAVIGCVICVSILGVLYLSTHFAIFNFTPYISGSYFAEGFFNVCEATIPNLLKTAQETIKGFIAGFKL